MSEARNDAQRESERTALRQSYQSHVATDEDGVDAWHYGEEARVRRERAELEKLRLRELFGED